jgi:hypothetical protein
MGVCYRTYQSSGAEKGHSEKSKGTSRDGKGPVANPAKGPFMSYSALMRTRADMLRFAIAFALMKVRKVVRGPR